MQQSISHSLNLRAGELVQVRSKEEILSTLDTDGRLEQMPFMPEMFRFCGQKFQVSKRAHKTCDPVNGLQSRRLPNGVHLEQLRCDGSAHSGCQAGCLIFWKEAWLKRVEDPPVAAVPSELGCTEDHVLRGTVATVPLDADGPTYICQATQVSAATTPLPWWDVKQYIEDYRSGNTTIGRMLSALAFWLYHNLCGLGLGFGSALRWAYDVFQRVTGGSPYPWRIGKIAKGTRTPSLQLDVREGETVRIKSYRQILETLDEEWKNRGLYFDAEMVPYTEGTFRVLKRVERIIHEKTGKMLHFKTPALILDNVVCEARYAKCRKLCPRGYYLYWREIWVEKV